MPPQSGQAPYGLLNENMRGDTSGKEMPQAAQASRSEKRKEGPSGTSTAIKKLIGLQPKTVTKIMPDGQQTVIAVALVMRGDRLRVKPGERIPVDGEVLSGTSFVDESMISGEPVAVEKSTGTKVLAGTVGRIDAEAVTATVLDAATLAEAKALLS